MKQRRQTEQIKVGKVGIGSEYPVSIQSMVSVPTKNIKETVAQISRLEQAGCELVRLGIPDEDSANALGDIKKQVSIPLIADIHFDYKLALISVKNGIDGLRINPGNLRNQKEVEAVVQACGEKEIPIRIGVNAGSLDRNKYPHPSARAMVESASGHIKILEDLDYRQIKVSLKSSNVLMMIEANRLFAERFNYPLHLGVTEAGPLESALIKNAMGIGILLNEGIGDTLRVSITGDVEKEVEAGRQILRNMGLRNEGLEIISCPMCARKEYDVEKMVEQFQDRVKNKKFQGKVAIMGCVVNGPGEAREADVGLAVGRNSAVIFQKGEIIKKIAKDQMLESLINSVEKICTHKKNNK